MAINSKKLVTICTSLGLSIIASMVFIYYSIWALATVR